MTTPIHFGEMHVVPVVNALLWQYPSVSVQLLLLDRVIDTVEEDSVGPFPTM
jgi:DNA-binding transcriptional LysR family regulator